MTRVVLFIVCLFCCFPSFGQDFVATVHYDIGRLEINSVKDIDFEQKERITIYSEEGNYLARSRFRELGKPRVQSFDVVVISADGSVVKKYSKKDFKEERVISDLRFYENLISYELDYAQNTYPYTVEVHAVSNSRFMFSKWWHFVRDEDVEVISSIFEVKYPKDIPVARIVEGADLIETENLSDDLNNHFLYRADSLAEYQFQPYLLKSDFPSVQIILEAFNFAGLDGSMATWENYSQWYNLLWKGRAELPKDAILELDKELANKNSDLEKAKAIYSYVQHKMRYVYVGYGNGGFQTMPADETFKLGYGDCKSLTNFTNAAMTYAGIKSYPTLVEAGSEHDYLDPNRPQNSFNHVFLCLPTIGDTTWLECTSKNVPFGYISDFTDDRNVLIIKPENGKLVRTPAFSEEDNTAIRHTQIVLENDGSAVIYFDGEFHNLAMDNSVFYSKENSSSQAIEVVKRELSLASFDLTHYESQCYPDDEPVLKVSLDVDARLFARKVGSKLMVKPFLTRNRFPDLDSTETRTLPVYFKRGYTMIDSVQIRLPEGYKLKDIPARQALITDFGSQVIEFTRDIGGSDLWVSRKTVLKRGTFPISDYLAICEFYQAVADSDGSYFIVEKE